MKRKGNYSTKSANFLRNIENHFREIAPRYGKLRTTDIEPILFIKKELSDTDLIHGADIGCGEGRYTVKLAKYLGEKCRLLYCVDKSASMLTELRNFFVVHGINHFKTLHSVAHQIPLETNSLDFVVSFNAIHHFNMPAFLKEASRILKNKSKLFIYSRLKNQNERNVWGRYFPNFVEKETRLYELAELKHMIENAPSLGLKSIRFFEYERTSTLAKLEEQARGYHYSTFRLFSEKEFDRSLEIFKKNIMENYGDVNKITWKDENVLLVIES